MECWLGQIGQVSDEGPGWSWLLYLLIFIIFPVINAIKDKFVERAQKKDGEGDLKSGLPIVPTQRRAGTELPVAKPVEPQKGPAFRIEPPQATPQELAKRRAPAPAPRPQPAAEARPATPRPVPVPRPHPAVEARPTTPRPAPRERVTPKAAPTEKPTRTLADVHVADPRVDIHAAAPGVDIRGADPGDVIHEAEPVIEGVIAEPDAAVGPLPVGPVILGRPLNRQELRRAVVLKEIFSPPIGLRGPGSMVGPDRP